MQRTCTAHIASAPEGHTGWHASAPVGIANHCGVHRRRAALAASDRNRRALPAGCGTAPGRSSAASAPRRSGRAGSPLAALQPREPAAQPLDLALRPAPPRPVARPAGPARPPAPAAPRLSPSACTLPRPRPPAPVPAHCADACRNARSAAAAVPSAAAAGRLRSPRKLSRPYRQRSVTMSRMSHCFQVALCRDASADPTHWEATPMPLQWPSGRPTHGSGRGPVAAIRLHLPPTSLPPLVVATNPSAEPRERRVQRHAALLRIVALAAPTVHEPLGDAVCRPRSARTLPPSRKRITRRHRIPHGDGHSQVSRSHKLKQNYRKYSGGRAPQNAPQYPLHSQILLSQRRAGTSPRPLLHPPPSASIEGQHWSPYGLPLQPLPTGGRTKILIVVVENSNCR